MKCERDHRVPLSARAMEILQETRELAGSSAFLFPGVRGDAISRGLKRLNVGAIPREVAQAALTHKESNKAIATYDRSDYLDQRRPLMEDWAEYLS